MNPSGTPTSADFRVHPAYEALVVASGLTAEGVFADPRITVWRRLPDRENCTLDVVDAAGGTTRLHVKRYPASAAGLETPALIEARGHDLLLKHAIPTAPLVVWGELPDRRSYTVWLDLAGYEPGDKLMEKGFDFDRLLKPTADLAAKLHAAGLHHRDLYLCHFLCRAPGDGAVDVKLIDTARVGKMPWFPLLRRRWIVKDLAQFWYSTTRLSISEAQRDAWLAAYAESRRDGTTPATYRRAIERKVSRIARHDARLNRKQPNRNVSIPT